MKKERLLELAGIQLNENDIVPRGAKKKAEKALLNINNAIEAAVDAVEAQGPIHRHEAEDVVKDHIKDFLDGVM